MSFPANLRKGPEAFPIVESTSAHHDSKRATKSLGYERNSGFPCFLVRVLPAVFAKTLQRQTEVPRDKSL